MKKVLRLKILLSLLVLSFVLYQLLVLKLEKDMTNKNMRFGVTFSHTYAKSLGLNWQETYLSILKDLDIKLIRIPTYWNDTETKPGIYDFSKIDFMVDQAEKTGTEIVMVLGRKQPRWPECHAPNWAEELFVEDRQQKTLDFIEKVVSRYNLKKNVIVWQVENEPFLRFGAKCDAPDKDFFIKEVEFVKKLDPTRPVMVTDSGELGLWATPMKYSDIFGTTLYRTVHDKIFGFIKYPVPASFYSLKSAYLKKFFAPQNKETVIAELQTEPWVPDGIKNTPIDKQIEYFTVADLKETVNFAQKTGFSQSYLWGVEWWYFMKQKGHPEYLEFVKSLKK